MSSTRVSIVVPTYNSQATIRYCLEGIGRQSRLDLVNEVVVVDSSPDQGTTDLVRRFGGSKTKLVKLGEKTAPGVARNLGVAHASGELLVFVDSDVCIAEEWVNTIVRAYEDECLAGSGSVCIPEFQRRSTRALGQLYLQFNEYLAAGARRPKNILPSCSMFCSRELFDRVGGFPELRASEDVVFFLTLNQHERAWLVPEARAFHQFRPQLSAIARNQVLLGKYACLYRIRHQGRTFFGGVLPVFLVPAILGVKFARTLGRTTAAGPKHLLALALGFPVFLGGLIAWAYGFALGCLEGRSG